MSTDAGQVEAIAVEIAALLGREYSARYSDFPYRHFGFVVPMEVQITVYGGGMSNARRHGIRDQIPAKMTTVLSRLHYGRKECVVSPLAGYYYKARSSILPSDSTKSVSNLILQTVPNRKAIFSATARPDDQCSSATEHDVAF